MTECIAPPGPDDLALVAYNEGDGDRATIEHLNHCSHCRARAETIAQSEKLLSGLLFRINCLSSDELQDYHFNFLPASQMAAFTRHLQSCPHCTRELTTLARFLASEPEQIVGWMPNNAPANQPSMPGASAHNLLQRIQTVLANVLQGGQGSHGGMTPAFGAMRGSDNNQPLYQAGDLQIGIDIQPDPQHPRSP